MSLVPVKCKKLLSNPGGAITMVYEVSSLSDIIKLVFAPSFLHFSIICLPNSSLPILAISSTSAPNLCNAIPVLFTLPPFATVALPILISFPGFISLPKSLPFVLYIIGVIS